MHIPEEDFNSFTDNILNTEDMIEFLEHLDTCDYCLEQLLQEESSKCIPAPSYLKEQILQKASSPEIQASKAAVTASRQMTLFCHSLKTAFGIITALFLLFFSGNIDFPVHNQLIQAAEYRQTTETPKQKNHLYDFTHNIGHEISKGANNITTYLNELSNKILNGGN